MTGSRKFLCIVLVKNGYKLCRGDRADEIIDEYVATDLEGIISVVKEHIAANEAHCNFVKSLSEPTK